jgi:hypothetical protein
MLTQDEQSLCRWCYLVAGYSRARLARDFECSVAEIEQVVGTGLAETMKSSSTTAKRKPYISAFQADSVQPQPPPPPKIDREIVRRVLSDL